MCADPRRRAAPRSRAPTGTAATSTRSPARDAELQLDEVEPGDRLGDGVLDLDAAVQLEEEELAAGDEELGRAGAPVADRVGERDGGALDAAGELGREPGRRGFLDDLLVAPLDGAVAQAERRPRRRHPR